MPDLKQSTSFTLRVGPVIDTAGAVVTSATLTIRLSKNGGAHANRNDATAITHDSNGYYLVTLNATDSNTVGTLQVAVTGTGFVPFDREYTVLPPAEYEGRYSGIGVAGSVNDASATTTSFVGDSGLSSSDDFYNGSVLVFTSGTLKGLARRVTDYVGSTRTFTLSPALPAAPANSVTLLILGRID